STYFSCPAVVTIPATQSTTQFNVGVSAGSCSVARFDIQQSDVTVNGPWFALKPAATTSSATAVADGYRGHSYQFRTRALSRAGVLSAWLYASTQVSSTATKSRAWSGLYTLDGYGGIQLDDSPPVSGSGYWPGWQIARAAKALPGANAPQSGLVLDGYGGLHAYGTPAVTESAGGSGHRWGWDIARDFAFLPDGTGGFVLDGYGGLHSFRVNGSTSPLQAQGGPYWAGWDIARKVVIFPDGGGGRLHAGRLRWDTSLRWCARDHQLPLLGWLGHRQGNLGRLSPLALSTGKRCTTVLVALALMGTMAGSGSAQVAPSSKSSTRNLDALTAPRVMTD